jgi:hypothetical protein
MISEELIYKLKMESGHSNLSEAQHGQAIVPPAAEEEKAARFVPGAGGARDGDRDNSEFGDALSPTFLSSAASSGASFTASQSSGADDEASNSDLGDDCRSSCPSPDGEHDRGTDEGTNRNYTDAEIVSPVFERRASRSRPPRASRIACARGRNGRRVKEPVVITRRLLGPTNNAKGEEDSDLDIDAECDGDSASESMIQELQETVALLSQRMESLQEQNMEVMSQILHLATTNVQLLAANEDGNLISSAGVDVQSNAFFAPIGDLPSGPASVTVGMPAISQSHEVAHPELVQLLSKYVKYPAFAACTPSDTEDDASSMEAHSDLARASSPSTSPGTGSWEYPQAVISATKDTLASRLASASHPRESLDIADRGSSTTTHPDKPEQ